jgi:gluconolactonase
MPAIRYDDGLSKIVDSAEWQLLADGFTFTEGPVWHPDGYLLFSDIPENRIRRWRDGKVDVFREPSGNSNGLTLDLELRLLACEHGNRRVSRAAIGADPEPLVTQYEGSRLNSPNDIIVRSDGRIFFTDPPYGITDDQRELPFNGVFTLDPAGVILTLIANDFDRPNGLALSPDERTLYVDDTNRMHVRAFDVAANGTLSNGRVFAEMRDGGRPDGMKVDREGRIYVTAGGVQVFDASGNPLGVIECPQPPANCAWGDDGSTLYITARTAVYRTRIATHGIAPHLR